MCCKADHADVVVNGVRECLVFRFAVKRLRFSGEARREAGAVTGRRRWDSNPRLGLPHLLLSIPIYPELKIRSVVYDDPSLSDVIDRLCCQFCCQRKVS